MTTRTDNELVRLLQVGQNDALAVLFERYHRLVFYIANNILKDEGEAEEAVQQTFIDLYRAIGQFNPERGSFKTWMLQFAYHRTLNRLEHLKARKFYELDDLSAMFTFPQQNDSPDSRHLLDELLATLKPQQRRVIELTYFHGMTAEEIAEKVDESAAVVRHLLYRGIKKLHDVLTGESAKGSVLQMRKRAI